MCVYCFHNIFLYIREFRVSKKSSSDTKFRPLSGLVKKNSESSIEKSLEILETLLKHAICLI